MNIHAVMAGDFVLDFENNKKVQNFIKFLSCCNIIVFKLSEKKEFKKSEQKICNEFSMKLTI